MTKQDPNSNVIHFNVGLLDINGKKASAQTIRLWTSTMAATRWMLQAPKPDQWIVHHGTGMSAVNNLAVVVEGFIGDMIYAQLDTNNAVQHPTISKLEKATWKDKREIFNRHFSKKLETYHMFPSIEILLMMRNNLLHGLSYTEFNEALSADGIQRSKIKSNNAKYEKARQYFIAKKLLADTSQMSNSESIWKMQIVSFLFLEVASFITSVIAVNTDNKFLGIESEWKTVSTLNVNNR